jgi:hypothetical protein
MSSTNVTGLSLAVEQNGFVVVGINGVPGTLGNYATVCLRGQA